MKRIGIDCRLWGIKHSGIGRYTEELVRNLHGINSELEFTLFCRRSDLTEITGLVPGWKIVEADIPHYGFAEQLKLPRIFQSEKLDLLHVPHFNVPLLYSGKFVATIHDLLWHEVKSWTVTTLSAPKYAVKYLAYRGSVRNTVLRAEKLIVPSLTVKRDLLKRFKLPQEKIEVTYEGVASNVLKNKKNLKNVLAKLGVKEGFVLYVGNLYPHKNVESIVRAVKLLRNNNLQIVIVSSRNVFQKRFLAFIKKEGLKDRIHVLGNVSDAELGVLYSSAKAFVFPSFSEGFGLPGLEAMAAGLPLLCSDIPVFHEIYNDAPEYFNPRDANDIAQKLQRVLADNNLRLKMIKKGRIQASKYSWKKMAEETLGVYNKVLKGGE